MTNSKDQSRGCKWSASGCPRNAGYRLEYSLLSKYTAEKLGLNRPQMHLTMNLAGGASKSEVFEIVEITTISPIEEKVKKTLLVYTVNKNAAVQKQLQISHWRNTLILHHNHMMSTIQQLPCRPILLISGDKFQYHQ